MWESDHKEVLLLKNLCFWIVVLEKTLESPLNYKEIKPIISKWNQPWIFTGRTVAQAEAPILCPPDAKSQLIGKVPDSGKDWRQKEKRAAEDEMVTKHYQSNVHESEHSPRDSEGQGSLVCSSPWGQKESDSTSWLNNNYKMNFIRDWNFKGTAYFLKLK